MTANQSGAATGVGAGLIWGLAFLIPEMVAAGSVELTLTRYLVYGVASVGLLVARWRQIRLWLDRSLWQTAFIFAVTGNLGYYFFVVLGIRLVGAPATVTIVGSLPVTVALLGNFRRADFAFRHLAGPVILVLAGLLLVNGVELWQGVARPETTLGGRVLGLICAFAALALWTSYGVHNVELLQRYPAINSADWSTVVGAATLALAALLAPASLLTNDFETGDAYDFLSAALVLGLVVSWGGTLLWNHASSRLPAAIIGMLVTGETMAGILYVSVYTATLPTGLQLLGVALVVVGVSTAVRLPRRPAPEASGASARPR